MASEKGTDTLCWPSLPRVSMKFIKIECYLGLKNWAYYNGNEPLRKVCIPLERYTSSFSAKCGYFFAHFGQDNFCYALNTSKISRFYKP